MRIVIAEAGIEYKTSEKPNIRTPEDAALQAKPIAAGETESVVVLVLNTKNRMLVSEVVTTGLLDSSPIHQREVFRRAIALNGAAIVLLHNHPSGDTTPSAEDVAVTRNMIEAGRIIGIRVLDHVVVGMKPDGAGMGWTSLREAGSVEFA
jgi:DNA repair protein RadC